PVCPEDHAGNTAGYRILKIDGNTFKGMQTRDVVYAMRGRAGTPATLTLLRDDRIDTRTVRREAMVFAPVTELLLPGGEAVVQIRAFSEKTPQLLRAALARLAARRPRGLIVDLRGDE